MGGDEMGRAAAEVAPETFRLEFPPDPSIVGAARIFVASLARHFGCEEEAVEDLKLAVSEACTAAVRERDGAGTAPPVRIVVVREPWQLKVSIEGGPVGGKHLDLIQALFPHAEAPTAPNAPSLLLSVPLST